MEGAQARAKVKRMSRGMALGSQALGCVAWLLLACSAEPGGRAELSGIDGNSERGGIGVAPLDAQGFSLAGSALDPGEYDRTVLAVTDTAISEVFSLADVMAQLASQAAGAHGTLTSDLRLFQQFWDTQRTAAEGLGGPIHCDDVTAPDESGNATFNGFRFQCPREEGDQAAANPFESLDDGYVAIGLTNRFDLAPADGATCGEYRVIFARRSGQTNAFERAFIIFEAELANPSTKLGLQGCRPVIEFWNDLAAETDSSLRLERLRSFYFDGLPATATTPAFMPVLHIDNYGVDTARPTGQIRTNQFMETPWTLREYKLGVDCGESCELVAQPVTVKDNPSADLFKPNPSDATQPPTDPAALRFQRDFLPAALATLAVSDVNRFSYSVPEEFTTGESLSQGTDDDYVRAAGNNASSFLRAQIRTALGSGATLTPNQILERTMALSCSGCHQRSNGHTIGPNGETFPSSQQFVHVSEDTTEADPDGGDRFAISPAMTDVFLPHRRQVLTQALNFGIKRTATAPTINGTIDAVWANAEKRPFRHVTSGTVSFDTDCSGTLRGLFDSTNLYLLVEVQDGRKINDSGSSPNADDDGIEIFIDANNDKAASYGADDAVYRMTWNVAQIAELKRNAVSGVSFARADSTTGYRIEIRLPWTTLGQTNLAAGATFGIDVQVNDDDVSGARDGKAGWWAADEAVMSNPGLMGTADLRD
jgi:hypothetical protein